MPFPKILLPLAALQFCCALNAEPRIPADPEEVLATVPKNRVTQPATLTAADAQKLIARHIRQFRLQDDPRHLGLAKGVLQRFEKSGNKLTPSLLLERASILESEHAFTAALTDLAAVVKAQPGNAQAWLNAATIQRLQGNYAESLKSCQQVVDAGQANLGSSCKLLTESLTGNAQESYRQLSELAASESRRRSRDPNTESWYHAMLGDLAVRLGQPKLAERHYRQAIQLSPGRSYARRELSDLMLSQQRPQEAKALLNGKTTSDSFLLRTALANKQLGLPYSQQVDELTERYAAAGRRGNNTHSRDQALFSLKLQDDPKSAIKLAKQNWQTQREPVDMVILLESAIAAGDEDTKAQLLQWRKQHKLEDQRISTLLGAAND